MTASPGALRSLTSIIGWLASLALKLQYWVHRSPAHFGKTKGELQPVEPYASYAPEEHIACMCQVTHACSVLFPTFAFYLTSIQSTSHLFCSMIDIHTRIQYYNYAHGRVGTEGTHACSTLFPILPHSTWVNQTQKGGNIYCTYVQQTIGYTRNSTLFPPQLHY